MSYRGKVLASLFIPSLFLNLIAFVTPSAAQTQVSFALKKTSTKTYATARVTADLNNDGTPDLIEPYARLTPGVLFSVQLGLGNGYFAAPVDYTANINHQFSDIVLTADVNRDAKADVIFITGSDLLVFLGKGDGTLLPAQHYVLPTGVGYAVVGDYNKDGIPDLILAFSNNTVAVSFGTGTGSFSTPVTVLTVGSTQAIETLATGDFDGDANLDFAVGLSNQPCNEGGCASDDVHIAYGNGAGTFTDKLVYSGVPGDLGFSSGDLNNDGKSDLVAQLGRPNSMHENALVLYGEASRSVSPEYLNSNGYFVGVGLLPAIADFNGDLKSDLANETYGLPGAPNDLALGFFLQGSSRDFEFQEIDFGASPPPDSGNFLTGDFNRDGIPDLLFTASDNSDQIFNVFDYSNTGGIGLRTRCEYPSYALGISECMYRSGTNGSTVAFGAASNWFEPLRKLELWLDGIKVTEQYNVWDKYAWLMSKSYPLSQGNHQAVIYSAGYDNVLQKQQISLSVPGPTCPPPATPPGINICSPVNGSKIGRSVETLAGGAISGTILRMEIWVDDEKMYSTFGSNQLDATITVAPGMHMFTFYVVSTSGDEFSHAVYATVQ